MYKEILKRAKNPLDDQQNEKNTFSLFHEKKNQNNE